MNLLIVDDDPAQLRLWTLILTAAGHHVRAAASPREAEAQLSGTAPDVLLMDLRMPRPEDGFALIRAASACPGKIVVLSGWPEDLDGRPEAEHVERLLLKPIRAATLLDTLRSLAPLFLCLLALAGALRAETFHFHVPRPAEVVAEIEMRSPGSDWSQPGREAALAVLTLDGRAPQHVMLHAGGESFAYRAFLGPLATGLHELEIVRDPLYSAPASGLEIEGARFEQIPPGDPRWPALAHAPILYARADTIGAFTDVPLVAYCERLTDRGRSLLQYTTIFSNEDGGTSTRGLMARWGRATDIEYIYRAWLDDAGQVVRSTFQAKGHRESEFRGRTEGAHPVLIPSTRNNMVAARGASAIRYQLPAYMADLEAHSREHVMDEHPFTYRVMAQELAREGKLRLDGKMDGGKIGDPRDYLYVEAKVANRNSGVAVRVRLRDEKNWRTAHLGRPEYAISRNGWVRTTIELPPGAALNAVERLGFECIVSPAVPKLLPGGCRVEEVSKVFRLNPDYTPGPSLWRLGSPLVLPGGLIRAFAAGVPARSLP